jgi:hypothetical protein
MIPYTELDEEWGQVKAADRDLETAEVRGRRLLS